MTDDPRPTTMTDDIIQQMRNVLAGVLHDDAQAGLAVHALIRTFGGERIYLPRNDYSHRNAELVSLHRAGADIDHLASRYRLARKTVKRILRVSGEW